MPSTPGASRSLILAVLGLAALLVPVTACAEAGRVLLLTSYHQGDPWTDRVVEGVRQAVGPADLRVEHLDARRMGRPEQLAGMRRHLAEKYAAAPLAALAAADDAAFALLLDMRGSDLPSLPLVFCGVNNFDPGRIQGLAGITGVNEQVDIPGTVRLALDLQPRAKVLAAVVADRNAVGRANLESFRARAASLNGRVEVRELLNLTRGRAEEVLGALPRNAVVLRLANLLEEDGRDVPLQESMRLISGQAPCPVFTFWDFDLGQGAVGGRVVSGLEQGRAAGAMLARILAGEPAQALPVHMVSPNVPMFDYPQLARFGIAGSSLPDGSVVLGQPEDVYRKYLPWMVVSLVFIGLQSWLIVTLLASRGRHLKAEAALREQLAARKRAEEALRAAKESAEAANRAKSEFLATMSHEIRTPLNGIQGMLQILDGPGLDPRQAEFVRVALDSSRSLTRILSDILDLSRIEAGAMDIAAEPFSLDAVLDPLCNVFASEAGNKGLEFACIRHPGLPSALVGDAGRIRQVLFNLIGNAVKYTDRGQVRAEVWFAGGPGGHGPARLCLQVADTGPGIPGDDLDKAFNLFTQLDGSSTRRFGGAGLGLAIVLRLMRLMGGSLAVSSEPGQGTEFFVTLPVAVHERPVAAAGLRAEGAGRGRRILVVEDEPVNRMATMHLLTRLGYAPHGAQDGCEALERLARESYAAVLMDIQMPGMDGIETTRRIRSGEAGEAARFLPVVALTAHAMSGDREQFLAGGMDGYIAKPVDLEEMGATLGRCLAGAGTPDRG
ncbi:MAG: ATP-binding protein [Thermodesulfobacteriota bacterium]